MKKRTFIIFISLLVAWSVVCFILSYCFPMPAKEHFSFAGTSIVGMIAFAFEIRFAFIPNKKMINTSKGFWQVIGKPNVYRIEMCVLFVMFSIFALHSFVAAIIALINH